MAKITFDFEAIKERVLKKLSSESEWASFLSYGVVDNVVSAIVNELYYDIQYGEYLSTENFWNLARNKSSLLQMSPMHGFHVPRKRGSVGTIRISTSESFDSAHGVRIPIPKFFQFSGGDLFVCSSKDYELEGDKNFLDLNCVQGECKSVSFLAEGLKYEEKIIYDDSVDNSNFVLTVNGMEWKCVDSLFMYKSEDMVYQITSLPNLSGIKIRFGNEVFGKKLNKNDSVEFKYVSTSGSLGNIYSSGIVTNVESQAFDGNGNPVRLYCDNITSFTGGEDFPSIDYIREISPKVYQTGERASSKNDYYTILSQMSDLGKISVWGAFETLKDENKDVWEFIPSEENVVHLAVLDNDYNEIDNVKKNEICEKLYAMNDPTDLIRFEKVYKIPMVFHVDAKLLNQSYTTVEVESYIKSSLENTYGIKKMNFGESVYNSDYVRLIDEVNGVDNHETYIELYMIDNILMANWYGTFQIPIYPINPDSVKIYIKNLTEEDSDWTLFVTCDENGNLIGEGEYITTKSNLDLNNGNGYLTIENGNEIMEGTYKDYIFKINYQYVEPNLKNCKRNNLLFYDGAVINLKYN